MPSLPAPRRAPRGFPRGTDNAVYSGKPEVPGWGCSLGAKGLQLLTRDVAGVLSPSEAAEILGKMAGNGLASGIRSRERSRRLWIRAESSLAWPPEPRALRHRHLG